MNKIKLSSGLLEMIPPLLKTISSLHIQQNEMVDFNKTLLQYMQSFIESSPIRIALLDLDCNIITSSKKWLQWFVKHMCVKPTDNIYGRNFLNLTLPCPAVIKKNLDSTARGKTIRYHSIEYKIKRKKRYISWESIALKDNDGNPLAIMLYIEDVTDNHEIVAQHKKLQETNVMLQNFSLIFSHDLIQPVHQISNFTTLLKDHIAKLNIKDSVVDSYFGAIRKSITQMKNLAEGIIFYCKQGQFTANTAPILLSSVIEEVVASCLANSNKELNILIDKELHLNVNKVCLLQLFQNLLTNAIKHSSLDHPTITLKGKEVDNGFYQIDFHNHGVCPAHLKHEIFQPFTSSFADGAGLGLMICKKIVSAYGGVIKINSTAKRGTTVSVTLPIFAFL